MKAHATRRPVGRSVPAAARHAVGEVPRPVAGHGLPARVRRQTGAAEMVAVEVGRDTVFAHGDTVGVEGGLRNIECAETTEVKIPVTASTLWLSDSLAVAFPRRAPNPATDLLMTKLFPQVHCHSNHKCQSHGHALEQPEHVGPHHEGN